MSYRDRSRRRYGRRKLTDRQLRYLWAAGKLKKRPVVVVPPESETIVRKETTTKLGIKGIAPTVMRESITTKQQAGPQGLVTKTTITKGGIQDGIPTGSVEVKKTEERTAPSKERKYQPAM